MENGTTALVIAIIGSNAFFGFLTFIIQFLVTRSDMKMQFGKKLDDLNHKVDKNFAILSRTHILRFADELRNGVHHSEESFRQQLCDIDVYESYCKQNPDFANGLTIIASQFIKDEFKKQYTEGGRKDENQQ